MSNTGCLQFLFVKLLSACQNDRMIVIRQICSINSGDSLISWLLLIHYWIPVSTKTYQFKSLYKTFYWQCWSNVKLWKIIVYQAQKIRCTIRIFILYVSYTVSAFHIKQVHFKKKFYHKLTNHIMMDDWFQNVRKEVDFCTT